MNKLFIIGNGFDMAHGLPTSYGDFIDSFWVNIKQNYEQESIKDLVFIETTQSGFLNFNPINSFEDLITNIIEHSKEYAYRFHEKSYKYYADNPVRIIFEFRNEFFKKLNIHKSIHNWVDVENLYYSELKKIIKLPKLDMSQSDEDILVKKKDLLETLNTEFNQIKKLFINYMEKEVIDKYDFSDNIGSRFWKGYYDILMPFSIHTDDISKVYFEFTDKDDVNELKNLHHDQREGAFFNTALFLCFNYTPTVQKYFSILREGKHEVKVNYIHNNIQGQKNSIIFGFGDEMDDDYKLIENIDDNEYLENFKSFQYLQNSNYNRLLDYINFNKFQVCILGHSCGLSDRVLLNTIFEHENCRSIKVYFHDSEEGDNYTDIIQNISRHFNSKSLMRERVVNKEFSKPMIQIQIPLKE